MHIVVDSEKMITEIGHRESLWKIQLDSSRKYLTEEQGVKEEITENKQNRDFKTLTTDWHFHNTETKPNGLSIIKQTIKSNISVHNN